MASGLKIPVGVNNSGGAALVEGEDQDQKVILLALGSDDNENAFQQDIGLGEGMVFDISDPAVRGKIIGRLRSIFREFEAQQRFRLIGGSIKWIQDSQNQELILEFKYLNLETDEPKTFRRDFGAEGLNG